MKLWGARFLLSVRSQTKAAKDGFFYRGGQSDEIRFRDREPGEGRVSQAISGTARHPNGSRSESGSELDEQIFRLQCLVCYLLEKNEELRHLLTTTLRDGNAEISNAEDHLRSSDILL